VHVCVHACVCVRACMCVCVHAYVCFRSHAATRTSASSRALAFVPKRMRARSLAHLRLLTARCVSRRSSVSVCAWAFAQMPTPDMNGGSGRGSGRDLRVTCTQVITALASGERAPGGARRHRLRLSLRRAEDWPPSSDLGCSRECSRCALAGPPELGARPPGGEARGRGRSCRLPGLSWHAFAQEPTIPRSHGAYGRGPRKKQARAIRRAAAACRLGRAIPMCACDSSGTHLRGRRGVGVGVVFRLPRVGRACDVLPRSSRRRCSSRRVGALARLHLPAFGHFRGVALAIALVFAVGFWASSAPSSRMGRLGVGRCASLAPRLELNALVGDGKNAPANKRSLSLASSSLAFDV